MSKTEFDDLLAAMVGAKDEVSDVLFVTGRPLQIESQGELRPFPHPSVDTALTSTQIEAFARLIMSDNQRLLLDLKEHGSCDCGYTLKDSARFRVNIYHQDGNFAIVMRHLRPQIPTFDVLNLGPAFREIIKEKTGIIFVTGGTGMGKTTTMAAMLNEINQSRAVHIVTLEDPIEFVLRPVKATFSQRELGRDFFSFEKGMRAAMRQAPKVIFIGEIRDRETMEIVLNAGETGHLVLTTLHTTSAATTINRIVGLFGAEEEAQIRERLAASMRYVISQRLVPAIAGGRVLVTEMLGSSLRSREAIRLGESENRNLDEIIEVGTVQGWHSFEQTLYRAYQQNLITEDTALLYCSNKAKMSQRIDTHGHRSGKTTATGSLSMEI